jgi:protein-disulfide isomerase
MNVGVASDRSEHQTIFEGIPVGFTEDGHPFMGNPDAVVSLEEWSDFLCPYCGRHFRQTLPDLLDQYIKTGKLRLVFRDFPLASLHPTAAKGHEAARCAGEQGVEMFWAMHQALFKRQNEWNRLPDPVAFLGQVAAGTGLDRVAWQRCLDNGGQMALVANSVEQGKALGFSGTPSFRFLTEDSGQGYDLVGAQPLARFTRLADPLIAGEAPPVDPKPDPPELPLWASSEGLKPDPQHLGFNLAGDAYKGDPEAPLVVVEFNDFQCPACRQHALETQPHIDKVLVDTGQVLWVAKHFPLRIHARAAVAAVAAECAGTQGKFWEMHHELFDKSDQWSDADADVEIELLALAKALQLDNPDFKDCFNSRKGLELVLQDLYDAQGVITSTPTFVIVQEGRGTLMRRALPGDQFVKLLNGRLKTIETAKEHSEAEKSTELQEEGGS